MSNQNVAAGRFFPLTYVEKGSFCCILSVRIWGHPKGCNYLNCAVSEREKWRWYSRGSTSTIYQKFNFLESKLSKYLICLLSCWFLTYLMILQSKGTIHLEQNHSLKMQDLSKASQNMFSSFSPPIWILESKFRSKDKMIILKFKDT